MQHSANATEDEFSRWSLREVDEDDDRSFGGISRVEEVEAAAIQSGIPPSTLDCAGEQEDSSHMYQGGDVGPTNLSWAALEARPNAVEFNLGRFVLGAPLVPTEDGGLWGHKFIATDCALDRRVVLWRFEAPKDVLEETERTRIRNAVAAEMDRLRHLRNARVCPYHTCEFVDGELNIIAGYAPGGSMADWLLDAGPLSEAPARRVVTAVVEGLAYLHGVGVMHGAVRGANVLLGPAAAVRLGDFGLAVFRARQELRAPSASRTWVAPEILQGGEASAAGDMWGLGCLVVEICTGAPPAVGLDTRAVKFSGTSPLPPLLLEESQALPWQGQNLVTRCLRFAPTARPVASELFASMVITTRTAPQASASSMGNTPWVPAGPERQEMAIESSPSTSP